MSNGRPSSAAEGRSCTWSDFWNLWWGNDNTGDNVDPEDEPGNQLAGWDARWASPIGDWPYAIYWQHTGETIDNQLYRPYRSMELGGVEVWGDLDSGASWRLNFEWADTLCSGTVDEQKLLDCAYNNGIFNVEGYRYKGRVLGHSTDGDAVQYAVRYLLMPEVGRPGTSWCGIRSSTATASSPRHAELRGPWSGGLVEFRRFIPPAGPQGLDRGRCRHGPGRAQMGRRYRAAAARHHHVASRILNAGRLRMRLIAKALPGPGHVHVFRRGTSVRRTVGRAGGHAPAARPRAALRQRRALGAESLVAAFLAGHCAGSRSRRAVEAAGGTVAALLRVRGRLTREQRLHEPSLSAEVALGGNPVVIRTFDDTPREDGPGNRRARWPRRAFRVPFAGDGREPARGRPGLASRRGPTWPPASATGCCRLDTWIGGGVRAGTAA